MIKLMILIINSLKIIGSIKISQLLKELPSEVMNISINKNKGWKINAKNS